MAKRQLGALLAGGALIAVGVAGSPATADPNPNPPPRHRPPVIVLKGSQTAVDVNRSPVHAGTIQFRVGHTYTDPQIGPDAIIIIKSSKIDKALAQIPKLNCQEQSCLPAAARAVTRLNRLSTIYGGSRTGGAWQVVLPKGLYWAVSLNSAFKGVPQKTAFRVRGAIRHDELHKTRASIVAKAPNRWVTKGLRHVRNGWVSFENDSPELHFLDMQGVQPGTTNRTIRRWIRTQSQPTFFTNEHFAFDVISPGVEVAIRGPIQPGKYLLACYMPSQSDGMPHAFMGMWKLVNVG